MAISIDRVRGITGRDLYREYVDKSRPVIMEDSCARWAAHGNWSLENLRARFGDRSILWEGVPSTIDAAFEAIGSSTSDAPAPYLRECYLGETLPELLPEVAPLPGDAFNRLHLRGLPGMGVKRRSGSPELLVAGRGRHFPVLHFDTQHYHAFITQVRGSKTFWFYRPDQTPHLYPRADAPNLSRIDRFDPADLERWPEYAKAQSTVVVVHPGETIFIPSGFWHRTRAEDLSIAVTWNSVSRTNWDAFVEDKYLQWTRNSRLKTAIKKSYFFCLGLGARMRDV